MATNNRTPRPKVELVAVLDDVREAMQQAIADHLAVAKANESGNEYYTFVGMSPYSQEMTLTVAGITGRFKLSFFGLKDASAVEEKRAATASQEFDKAISRMTSAEKQAKIDELLKSL